MTFTIQKSVVLDNDFNHLMDFVNEIGLETKHEINIDDEFLHIGFNDSYFLFLLGQQFQVWKIKKFINY